MKNRCVLEIELPDEDSAKAAEKAVGHEGEIGSRSDSEIIRKGKKLMIRISAKDVVAMRATINAFMREFQVFEKIEIKG